MPPPPPRPKQPGRRGAAALEDSPCRWTSVLQSRAIKRVRHRQSSVSTDRKELWIQAEPSHTQSAGFPLSSCDNAVGEILMTAFAAGGPRTTGYIHSKMMNLDPHTMQKVVHS